MKIKSTYIGIKLEPHLKKEAEKEAKRQQQHLSEWIRLAIKRQLYETVKQ